MTNILFLGVPSQGHVNPTIGLVSELVNRGNAVTYFATHHYKGRIEADSGSSQLLRIIQSGPEVIADVLTQIQGLGRRGTSCSARPTRSLFQ